MLEKKDNQAALIGEQNAYSPEIKEKNAPKRLRKSKDVILAELDQEEAEATSSYQKKIARIRERRARIALTPKQRKEAKKRAEDHCKIIAGVTALELSSKGNVFFTIQNFKNRLFRELTEPLEINFIKKYFKE